MENGSDKHLIKDGKFAVTVEGDKKDESKSDTGADGQQYHVVIYNRQKADITQTKYVTATPLRY